MNGPRTDEQRFHALEETTAALSHAMGHIPTLEANLARNTERLDALNGTVAGLGVKIDQGFAALVAKIGAVDGKAELGVQTAQVADMKATRASLTNEAELPTPPATPNVDAYPSRSPGERAAADVAGTLAVEAFRGMQKGSATRVVLAIVIAVATAGGIGAKLQACNSASVQHTAP